MASPISELKSKASSNIRKPWNKRRKQLDMNLNVWISNYVAGNSIKHKNYNKIINTNIKKLSYSCFLFFPHEDILQTFLFFLAEFFNFINWLCSFLLLLLRFCNQHVRIPFHGMWWRHTFYTNLLKKIDFKTNWTKQRNLLTIKNIYGKNYFYST